ncbi:MAG: hypothetical protein HY689_16020 [Chloroflexi bacterium]|nr:hypothetical protein [Chloroflexota bacterium]
MVPLVLTLDDDLTPETAGTKAATLARLRRAGLPVPPGFCLTVAAYQMVLATAGLADTDPDPAGARQQAALRAAWWPPDLKAALAQAYRDLGEGPVAVRSSGVAEDLAGASYAGQYETFLNVEGLAEVQRAVRACWASALAPRALAYRRQHGGGRAAMGVLVQRMVPAEAAGVLFTRAPQGDQAALVIEAARGLGDAVVSSRTTPDRYRLRRDTLELVALEAGDPASDGGSPVAPALTPEAARTLAALGLQVEGLLGGPQDIEWAWAGGRPCILQARPITTVSSPPPREAALLRHARRYDLWSRANVGEVFPGVVSPLAWSAIRETFQGYYQDLARKMGARPDEMGEVFGLFYGRVYVNIGVTHHLVTEHLGFSSDYFETSLGGPGRAEGLPLPRHPMRWTTLLRRLPAILRQMRTTQRLPDQAASIVAEAAAWDRRFRDAEVRSWSLEDLVQANRELGAFLGPGWVFHVRASGEAMSAFGMLASLLDAWFHDPALANDLVTGLTTLTTAEIAVALWRIARRAAADRDLRARIAATEAPDLPAALSTSPAGRACWQELCRFLEQYGHRANNELDSREPRWADDPRPILATFRGYVLADAAQDPGGYAARQRQRREDAERAVLRRLAHPLDRVVPVRRALFRMLVARARRLLPLRENVKHELLRVGRHQRRVLLALGERLVALGLLEAPDDIFFLEVGEVEALAGTRREALGARLRRRVRQRRQERAQYLALDPPEIIVPGHAVPRAPAPAPAAAGRVLTGLGASSGRVTGPARVLTDPGQADQLRPGEVLVAPFTDPGWTPVFPLAAAIVMDLGGLLSHGAIIAREYGIPAVVNVRSGTHRIRTGQIITVDGARGTVLLEEEHHTTASAEMSETER